MPAADLGALLESGDSSDVTLLCGGERLRAHTLILSARSPVFRAGLRGPLACSLDAVPVPDFIQPAIMRRVLRFIYTDELQPASAEEAQHLLIGQLDGWSQVTTTPCRAW